MKKQLVFLLMAGSLLSCHKDHNDPPTGTVYEETSPTPGGMKIDLLNNTQIINSPSGSGPDSADLWFALTDSNRYEVSTCEPGLPCPAEADYYFVKE